MFKQLSVLLRVLKDGKRDQKEIASIQHKRLHNVLISAYENVEYYRMIMQKADYNPLIDYSGPEDLRKLPILTKEKLKQLPISSFIHKGYQENYKNEFSKSTSGSTGMPFTIYRSKDERLYEIAKWLRVLFDNGYSITDKVISFTIPSRMGKGKNIFQKLGLFRRKEIDIMLPENEILNELKKYRPDIIYGNKITFDLICNALKKDPIGLSLKFIAVTGEVLGENDVNRYEKILKTKVVHSYGSIEMGTMAHSKAHNPFEMSLNSDLTFFEFINDKGKPAKAGERSRVIVTDLMGKLMPFIRYDQGDLIYFDEKIENGEILKILTRVIGRQYDMARLPNGEIVTFLEFNMIMNKYESIKQFKIIQKEADVFEVLIASESDYFEQIILKVENDLNNISNQKLIFDIKNVPTIPADPNGKLKTLVSKII